MPTSRCIEHQPAEGVEGQPIEMTRLRVEVLETSHGFFVGRIRDGGITIWESYPKQSKQDAEEAVCAHLAEMQRRSDDRQLQMDIAAYPASEHSRLEQSSVEPAEVGENWGQSL